MACVYESLKVIESALNVDHRQAPGFGQSEPLMTPLKQRNPVFILQASYTPANS
jgi:hypothetical protein